jgi:hypothetical protein
MPGRQLVAFRGAGLDPAALGLCRRLQKCVALGLDRDPVLLAELRNPLL